MMQGKDEMIDDILQAAEKSAAAVVGEATAAVEAEIESLRAELESSRKADDAATAKAADAAYSGKVKLAELDAGKILLKAKQDCVAAVYARVREMLVAMPQAEYRKLMARLVTPVLENGDEIVIGKTDKRLNAEWVKSLATATKKKLGLSKDRGEFEAGVVLRNAVCDRDFTVDAIVADLRERTVTQTVQKLGL